MFTKLLSCIICDSDDQNTSGPERRENHGTLTEICAGRRRAGNGRTDSDHRWNIYPLIHAIYYVDTVEIVEIEKQYKQECV